MIRARTILRLAGLPLCPLWAGLLIAGCGTPGAKYGVEGQDEPVSPSTPPSTQGGEQQASGSSSRDPDLWAQSPHFSLRLGLQVFANNQTVFEVNNDNTGGRQEVSLEKDLGFDTSSQVGRLDFGWRFGKRHMLGASWFRLESSASKTIEEEITIGDVTFPIDATVWTAARTDVIKLDYRYSFYQSRRWDASFGVGLHTMLFDVGLGTSVNDASLSASVTLPAPVPVIGLSASHAFTPRTRLSANADLFGIRFDSVGGYLVDGGLTFDYDLTRRFGVGFGLNYFDMTIGADGGNLGASLDWSYLGFLFFLRGML